MIICNLIFGFFPFVQLFEGNKHNLENSWIQKEGVFERGINSIQLLFSVILLKKLSKIRSIALRCEIIEGKSMMNRFQASTLSWNKEIKLSTSNWKIEICYLEFSNYEPRGTLTVTLIILHYEIRMPYIFHIKERDTYIWS